MPSKPYKVIVVVDRDYGEKLFDIAPNLPVWIIGSPCNEAAAEQRWKEVPTASHLTGITVLKDSPQLSPESKLLANLDTIDLHHGVYSSEPPYTVLEIVGTLLSENIAKEFGLFGFDEFVPTINGFVATRPLPPDFDQIGFRGRGRITN